MFLLKILGLAHTANMSCSLLHSLRSHSKKPLRRGLPFLSNRSGQMQANLPVKSLLIQATQLSFHPGNPSHFSSSSQMIALKKNLEKLRHMVKINYFPLWKVEPHRNSSTGLTQDYLSATEVMWNSSLQLCKQIDQHYRNPQRGRLWSVACFVQVLNWMGTHILFPSATKLWGGSPERLWLED